MSLRRKANYKWIAHPITKPLNFGKQFSPGSHLGKKNSQGKGQDEHSCSTPTIAGREEVQTEEQERREAEGPVWSFPFVPCLDLPSQ